MMIRTLIIVVCLLLRMSALAFAADPLPPVDTGGLDIEFGDC